MDRDTPWKETPPWTDNPRAESPPPEQSPPWTETHLEGIWDQGQDSSRRNKGPGSRRGSDIIENPPVDRQTPVKIIPCPKLRLRAVMNRSEIQRAQCKNSFIFCQQCLFLGNHLSSCNMYNSICFVGAGGRRAYDVLTMCRRHCNKWLRKSLQLFVSFNTTTWCPK